MWGDSIIRYLDKRSPEDKARASLLNNSKDLSQSKQFIATSGKASQGNFCSLCGAWRGELGLEPTFELYIKHLLQIFTEVKRVLKKTGTCWVNLGDTYNSHSANSKNVGGFEGDQMRNNQAYSNSKITKKKEGVPDKSLCCIPDRFKIAMVDSGWICRNEIIWYKRNCMPSSASDRFTVDFEKIFFFSKQGKYYFEQMFEENETVKNRPNYTAIINNKNSNKFSAGIKSIRQHEGDTGYINPQGRNMRTVWDITTQGYKEAHFATFPPELPRRCITAGCPKDICKKCGKAREKILERVDKRHWTERNDYKTEGKYTFEYLKTKKPNEVGRNDAPATYKPPEMKELGYTDCGCNTGWDKGIVLDPFMGSGTTALVAKQLCRNWVGIELNEEYIKMAEERINREPEPLF